MALSTPSVVTLDRSWWSWAGPHGGHTAGHLVRAAAALDPGRPLRTASVSFLRALSEGAAPLEARVVRRGRSSTLVHASLLSGQGAPAVSAVCVLGAGGPGPQHVERTGGPVPAPEGLASLVMPPEMELFARFAGNVEFRPVSAPPLSGGGSPDLLAWARMRDGGAVDTQVAAVLTDVMPPALFGTLTAPVGVPTVHLDITLLEDLDDAPVDDWVLLRITTRSASGGWCVDDSEVRARDGRLLALGRQTRLVLA